MFKGGHRKVATIFQSDQILFVVSTFISPYMRAGFVVLHISNVVCGLVVLHPSADQTKEPHGKWVFGANLFLWPPSFSHHAYLANNSGDNHGGDEPIVVGGGVLICFDLKE